MLPRPRKYNKLSFVLVTTALSRSKGMMICKAILYRVWRLGEWRACCLVDPRDIFFLEILNSEEEEASRDTPREVLV